jgi:C1A family cysteine protease
MTDITPSGRHLGRKPDRPDARDLRYSAVHRAELAQARRSFVDLSDRLPPVVDQGALGSCGPTSIAALMSFLYPEQSEPFSRLQMYWNVRVIEGTTEEDAGVETRTLFRVAQLTGMAPEKLWPYESDGSRYLEEPTEEVFNAAGAFTIDTYSRLVAASSYLACLNSNFPIVLGFIVPESLDGDDIARHGVMAMPAAGENYVGGHVVVAVGYDTNFKSSDVFKKSGVDPARMSDVAIKIRNSWGPSWGLKGHFWMPLPFATNPSTGGDAWTARRRGSPSTESWYIFPSNLGAKHVEHFTRLPSRKPYRSLPRIRARGRRLRQGSRR